MRHTCRGQFILVMAQHPFQDSSEWNKDAIDYDLVDNPYGYSRSPSAMGEYYGGEDQEYRDYEQQLQEEQAFSEEATKPQEEKPRHNVPKPSRYKPRDTIVLGGHRELERPDNINRQTHAITKTSKVGRPTDNLRMEGNRELTREQASAHFGPRPEKIREPRGNLRAEGQMDLERSGSINRIRHGQTARDKASRPNDQIRLEGEYTMRTGRDEHGRMEVSRTARAGAPTGALQIDKNDKMQTHTSRDDHVAFASARPGRAGPGRDNMNVKEGDMDFKSQTRETYRQAAGKGGRPERVRKANDNMKVGTRTIDLMLSLFRLTFLRRKGRKPFENTLDALCLLRCTRTRIPNSFRGGHSTARSPHLHINA